MPKKNSDTNQYFRTCFSMLLHGLAESPFAWVASILSAAGGVVFSALSLFALAFAIIQGAQSPIVILQYELPFSYSLMFYICSALGIIAYASVFWFDRCVSSKVDINDSEGIDNQRQPKRMQMLSRILACRIKYLVAPFFLILLLSILLALYKQQYTIILLMLVFAVLIKAQNILKIKKMSEVVFSDRALTPLKIGLSRLVIILLIGGLLISFNSYFNVYSLLVMLSFMAFAVHLARCLNLCTKVLEIRQKSKLNITASKSKNNC